MASFGKKFKSLARKAVTVNAGIATLGLVKPKLLGIKSESNSRLFKTTGKIAKGAAIAVGGTFALAGAPVALGGAGVGSGGLFGGAGGFLSGGLSKAGSLFGKRAAPGSAPDAGDQGGGMVTSGLGARMLSLQKGGPSVDLARIQGEDAGPGPSFLPVGGGDLTPWLIGGAVLLGAVLLFRGVK